MPPIYGAKLGLQNGHQSEKNIDEINAGKVTGVTSRLAPGMSQPDVQTNATSLSPAQPPASAAAIRPKIRHPRPQSHVRHRVVDVKKRLIALWHHSLAQTEKSSTCTLFSDSNKGGRKGEQHPRTGAPRNEQNSGARIQNGELLLAISFVSTGRAECV